MHRKTSLRLATTQRHVLARICVLGPTPAHDQEIERVYALSLDPGRNIDLALQLRVRDAIAERFAETGPIRITSLEEVRLVRALEGAQTETARTHVLQPHEMAVPLVA